MTTGPSFAAPPPGRSAAAQPARWWFAGADPAEVLALLDEQASVAGANGDRPVSQVDRIIGAGPARLGIVDPDARKLRLARRLVAKGEHWHGRSDIWFSPAGLAAPATDPNGKVVFLFPGVEPAAAADTIDLPGLGAALGIDAPQISYDTVAHQGASIFQLGLFLDTALHILGVEPDLAAGHSVGEWAGAVASGIVPTENADDFLSALDLHGLVLPAVDFAAITAGVGQVTALVGDLDEVVVSHDNCPNQTVICGPPPDVDLALARLREQRIIGQKLPFQSGFHTPAISPALGTLRQMIGGIPIGPGRIPMWSATSTAPFPADPEEFRELHLRHLIEPVRFRELIEHMYDDAGARIFVQLGTGSLAGFVDDTLRDRRHAAVEVLNPKRSALAQMHRTLTALWVEGVDVRPERLRPAARRHVQPANGHQPAPAAASNGAGTARPVHAAGVPAGEHDEPGVDGNGHGEPTPYSLVAASDLLAQAAAASRQVLHALAAYYGPADAPPEQHTAVRPDVSALTAVPATVPAAPAHEVPSAPAPAHTPPRRGPTWPTRKIAVTRHLSLATRPETIDHSLNLVPEGWPDPGDGFPIMAMTTQIDLLREVASEYGGGRPVIEVFEVRNLRWLDLTDPIDVEITIAPSGPDTLALTLGGYCRLKVRFGEYPAAPPYREEPITDARPTRITAQEMFDQRIMFHGPAFQGVDEMGPIGEQGMLGVFTHLPTPGSLLDNLGKLVAYWVIDTRDYIGEGALPTGLGRVEFFGPEPAPGTKVRCDIRIRHIETSLVRADGVLVLPDGRLWCRVENWTSLVFHLDEIMEQLYHHPTERVAVEPQPGGWTIVRERWPGGTARDMTSRRFLGRAERETYAGMNLLEQRRWLLDTIAVKETARLWLLEHHGVRCYPVELAAERIEPNRYRITSSRVPDGHDLTVTICPMNWATAAILSDGGDPLDIEARIVPADATADEAEAIAREAAKIVAGRNPGREVASVAEPENIVPSIVTDIAQIAAAWTAR